MILVSSTKSKYQPTLGKFGFFPTAASLSGIVFKLVGSHDTNKPNFNDNQVIFCPKMGKISASASYILSFMPVQHHNIPKVDLIQSSLLKARLRA